MTSNERWFLFGIVVGYLVIDVAFGIGLPHRLWPDYFDAPKVCAAPASQALAAIKIEFRMVLPSSRGGGP